MANSNHHGRGPHANRARYPLLNIVAPYLADMKETIVVQTFRRLQAVAAKHLGPSGSTPPAIALAEFPSFALWWDIMLCGDSDPKETRAMLSKPLLESLQYYLHETLSAGTRLQHDDALRYTQWICRVISAAMCNQAFQQIGDREDDSGPLFPAAFLRLQAEQLLTGDRQLGVEDGAIKYLAAAADRQLNAMLPHRGWQPSRTLGLGDCITLSFILVLCTIRISAAPQVSQDRATLSTRTSEVLSHVSEALRITGCQTAFPNTESLQSVVDSLRGLRKCLVRDSQPYPSSPSPIPEDLLPRIKEFLSTLRQVCSSGGLGYGRTEHPDAAILGRDTVSHQVVVGFLILSEAELRRSTQSGGISS
ncbi:hypothetical protein BV20DRAFT_237617 [Pilatotrama ljubarskyi]|nr:hypothetical protein BV20DRAFT_237617 [Pilatotrama ljubarskyi]